MAGHSAARALHKAFSGKVLDAEALAEIQRAGLERVLQLIDTHPDVLPYHVKAEHVRTLLDLDIEQRNAEIFESIVVLDAPVVSKRLENMHTVRLGAQKSRLQSVIKGQANSREGPHALDAALGREGVQRVYGVLNGPTRLEGLNNETKIALRKNCEVLRQEWVLPGSVVELTGQNVNGTLVVDRIGGIEAAQHERAALRSEGDNHERIVVLAEVHLDVSIVRDRLTQLFEAFDANNNGALPTLVVLCGSFLSVPFSATSRDAYIRNFRWLAELLQDERWSSSTFVLVPGPNDPTQSGFNQDILPQGRLSAAVLAGIEFSRNVRFCANPCRLKVCGQEWCILRDNITQRMQRSALNGHALSQINPEHCTAPPTTAAGLSDDVMDVDGDDVVDDEKDVSSSTAAAAAAAATAPQISVLSTLVNQRHLRPGSLAAVDWRQDGVLSLEQSPDVLVVADTFPLFAAEYAGTLAFNPSSFSSGFCFVFYNPFAEDLDQVIQHSSVQ